MNDMASGDTINGRKVAGKPDEPSFEVRRKERFIPVNRHALQLQLEKDARENSNGECRLDRVLRYLCGWRHQQYRRSLNELKNCFLPFSPDRDTLKVIRYSKPQREALQKTFLSGMADLLTRANYEELTIADLNRIISAQSRHRLHVEVDLDEYDEIRVFCRGNTAARETRRHIKSLFRKKTMALPVYQRLFLLLKLKPDEQRIPEIMSAQNVDEKRARKLLKKYRKHLPSDITTDHIHLKLFKRIPQTDLAMMFPNIKVQFKLFDKVKLALTASGGTIAGIMAILPKVAAATGALPLLMAIGGFGSVLFRQVSDFFSLRNKYQMVLAKRLYFHSLADNRAVLTLLADRAAEEDLKEEMLLYWALDDAPCFPDDLKWLKKKIEFYLENSFGRAMNFDLYDALKRLQDDGLIRENPLGALEALPEKEACDYLRKCWENYLDDPETFGDEEGEVA